MKLKTTPNHLKILRFIKNIPAAAIKLRRRSAGKSGRKFMEDLLIHKFSSYQPTRINEFAIYCL